MGPRSDGDSRWHFNALVRPGVQERTGLLLLVWSLLPTSLGYGQEATNASAQAQAAQTAGPSADIITAETIDAALKEVDEATDLDEVTRGQLKEIYNEAKTELGKAAGQLGEATRLKSSIESAAADIEQAGKQKESLQGYDFDAVRSLELNDLNRDLSTLEQQLTDTKNELLELQAEPQRRVDRLAAIPEEISNARSELAKLQVQLSAIDSSDPSSLPSRAQGMLLQARRQAQLALVDRLGNERGAYEAQGELPRLRSDLLTSRVKQLEQDILGLVNAVTERRKTDAAEQKANAELAWQSAPQWLKLYAQVNIDLADRRIELASDIRYAVALRDAVEKQLARWQEDFERTKKRTAVMDSDSLGMLLVEKRSELPSVLLLKRHILEGDTSISTSQQELYELEDRRVDLSDVNAAAEQVLADLRKQGLAVPADPDGQFQQLFNAESQILDSLLKDANRNYSLRIATRESQRKLIDVVDEYRDFIDQKVFWVPSTAPLQPLHIVDSARALRWLVDIEMAKEAVTQFGRHLGRRPFRMFLLLSAVLGLLLFRPRLRGRLTKLGEVAAPVSCRTIVPTLRATLITLLLAAPWPALLWALGWTLSDSTSEPVRATAKALTNASWWWLMLGFIGRIWRPHGLADAHFGWSTTVRAKLNRCLHLLMIVGTPLVFLGSVYQQHGDPAFRASMGRLALIALMLLIAWCCWRLFLKQGVERESDEDTDSDGQREWSIWSRVAVIVPLTLAFLAAIGFNYSAFQLTLDCVLTFTLVLILLVLRAVLFRWVRVARRRIRWRQLIDARQQRVEGQATSDVSDIAALVSKEEETDLAAMDRQTRRLISIVIATTAVIGSVVIWLEVLPALTPLLQTPVNPFHLPSDTAAPITIGSLLLASAIFVLMIAGWRNIPGLIDVLLLGRLGIESSIRYAITTLSQYAIGIAGTVLAFNAVGMSWGQVQWLVAAMGVGLGFGLQEIVANFVCGVLLLFERPIRVGDIVTLGDTTGVVVRIRSRATTIRNWDRQEVVIPNKELITGRITNWTLSDHLNRLTLQVGIAYGSDTDHARELLLQVLSENPKVIDDPRPLVTFEQFGDSSLNFVIRAYLDNIDDRLETLHQLHTCIHQRFNAEGIEIAFPQQDLHLRSVDPAVRVTDATAPTNWAIPASKTQR